MPVYAVTYDLNKEKNYDRLWAEMKRLGAHKAALSFYLLSVNLDTSKSLLDHLKSFVDDDDRIIVVKTTKRDIATLRAFQGTSDWLKE